MIEHSQGLTFDPRSGPCLVRLGVGVEQLEVCVVLAICVVLTRSADPCSDLEGRPWSWVAVTDDISMNS